MEKKRCFKVVVGQAMPDVKKDLSCPQAAPIPRIETLRGDEARGSGFTLIELLVVVLIIGILAAVALPKYEMAVMRSRYATLKANVNALMDAEKIYYLANGEYTEDLEALSVDLTGCTLSNSKKQCTYPWGYCAASLGTKRVHCQNTTTLQNAYVRYWERPGYGSSTCWALTDNRTDKYNKLCEREGGVFVAAGSCTGPCVTYKLTD